MATPLKKSHASSQTEKIFRQKRQRYRSLSEHFVQFCETDAFLMNSVSEFIGAGLRAGDACIVIATKPHRENLEERLKGDGLEVAAARERGHYASIDAAATLSKFMVDGSLEPGRFADHPDQHRQCARGRAAHLASR